MDGTQGVALMGEVDELFEARKARQAEQRRRGLTTRRRAVERCPNNHAAWHLYTKQVDQETIISCKECEKGG
jgi:hypothetical protein